MSWSIVSDKQAEMPGFQMLRFYNQFDMEPLQLDSWNWLDFFTDMYRLS